MSTHDTSFVALRRISTRTERVGVEIILALGGVPGLLEA
jgi:hypothetical protein